MKGYVNKVKLKLREISSISKQKLRNNYSTAISLNFIYITGYLCILFFSQALLSLVNYFKINMWFTSPLVFSFITVIIAIIFLFPLSLNLKEWYMNLNGEITNIGSAFQYYSSFKKYIKVVSYIFTKYVTLFLINILLFIPLIFLATIIKIGYDSNNQVIKVSFVAIFLLFIIFCILMLILFIYLMFGFFFTDYIYIKKITLNPFKAMVLSYKFSKGNRVNLLRLYFRLIPYYLLYILIIPIPFILPKIQSNLACFADNIINQKNVSNA